MKKLYMFLVLLTLSSCEDEKIIRQSSFDMGYNITEKKKNISLNASELATASININELTADAQSIKEESVKKDQQNLDKSIKKETYSLTIFIFSLIGGIFLKEYIENKIDKKRDTERKKKQLRRHHQIASIHLHKLKSQHLHIKNSAGLINYEKASAPHQNPGELRRELNIMCEETHSHIKQLEEVLKEKDEENPLKQIKAIIQAMGETNRQVKKTLDMIEDLKGQERRSSINATGEKNEDQMPQLPENT